MIDITARLTAANKRLKSARIRVTIEQRGDRLVLRGTFPDKNGGAPHQQRIPIAQANLDGLKVAEAEAKAIGDRLDQGRFDWGDYEKPIAPVHRIVSDTIRQFERRYFQERERTPQSENTWLIDYEKPFRRLPAEATLSVALLEKILLETRPDTRTRRRVALAFGALADFAGLKNNLRGLVGKYSARSLSPRDLPTDELITETRLLIPAADWRWAFSVMSAYGLRNHEIFFLDFDDFPAAFVFRGKRGERYVYPLYPEWASDWDLAGGTRPDCSGKCNADLGHRVSQAFRRYKLPFDPYDLRHAWAVRAIVLGLPDALAAEQMGHSLAVHNRIYQHWISRRTHQQEFDRLLARTDRPLPPR